MEGLEFHRFYFDNGSGLGYGSYTKCTSFVLKPHVHIMGDDGAVIAYTRLTQALTQDGQVTCQEKIWNRTIWNFEKFITLIGTVKMKLGA